jgi:hypothetical protein
VATGKSMLFSLLSFDDPFPASSSLLAVELDLSSFANALKHVTSNGLGDRIRVVKVEAASEDSEMQGQGAGVMFGFDRLFEQVPGMDSGTEKDGHEYVHIFSLHLYLSH